MSNARPRRGALANVSRRRLLLSVVIIASSVYVVLQVPIRLGLDLRGGTQIVLEAQDTADVKVDADVTARTLEVLRRRIDGFGVAEPTLQVSGVRRIIVELPGLDDPDRAVEVIGRTAQLTFHPVVASYPEGSVPPEEEHLVLPGNPGEELVLGPMAVSGEQVAGTAALFDAQGSSQWVVSIDFRASGGRAWEDLTSGAACAPPGDPSRRVAIVLDSMVVSSPAVASLVACDVGITGGATVISGSFTEEEAHELALLIRAGALPVPVEVIEQSTIGPSLGAAAVRASVEAAMIGASLTILYMIAFYRLMGVVAAVSLGVYAVITYAVLAAMGATLTLPGMAGFVLAVGMAVDANVLVYERAKEEYRAGSSVRDSIVAGFNRAWSAIADTNMTTLLAALLLFSFASGAVRGFGVTLSIGVVVSMFSALVVTRLLLELLSGWSRLQTRPETMGMTVGLRFQTWISRTNPNLLGPWRRWLGTSALFVALAVTGLVVSGVNLGLEFVGGQLREFVTSRPVDTEVLRSELAERGLPRPIIQESGAGNVVVRTEVLDADSEQTLLDVVQEAGGPVDVIRDQFVGPTLGEELRNRALVALGIALLLQWAYLTIRFRWTIAVAAVASMVHDVVILVGAFAWLGKTFDGVFLAALLTVIGYSINDSVVIFDRIREQQNLHPEAAIEQIANTACLQTVPRTINTGLGALLILVSLYFLGGDTLADFALALVIGIVVGTYSSVFTAAPIAIALEERYSRSVPKLAPNRIARVHGGRRS